MLPMPNILVYTKPTCPYCKRAKALLHQKGVSFKEMNIQGNDAIREAMIAAAHGRTTVPQIFINNTHIGGCDDLYALESQGKLDPLLTT